MTKYTKLPILLIIFFALIVFTACTNNNDGKVTEFNSDDSLVENITDSSDSPESIDETEDLQTVEPLYGFVIVLDPGHGTYSENYKEPVSPGSTEMKIAFSTGTSGAYISEAEFNLIVAKKLSAVLVENGAEIHLTRSDEYSISNVERAKYANDLNADLAVRIHADGSSDVSLSGISVLVPALGTIGQELENKSRAAAEYVLDELISATGAGNRGIIERSDMTGFNWSTVPVILVECGFMSNPNEDALLANEAYQDRIVHGIAEGIIEYFQNQ